MIRLACLLAGLLLPLAATAQDQTGPQVPAPDPVAQLRACVTERTEAKEPAAPCVNEAQGDCLQYPLDTAPDAATKCFLDRKETWGAAIAERMAQIEDTASGDILAVAGIEVKYDLMGNLMQCDRLDELTLLREDPSTGTRARDARCEATATGLAYVKLLLQSRELQ